ncbi:MAG TPA: hypothetical protein DDY91_03925 [Planctomycetaceae bacterium]|nr:hypothetical protein [Planctomycetaceae bacterium]
MNSGLLWPHNLHGPASGLDTFDTRTAVQLAIANPHDRHIPNRLQDRQILQRQCRVAFGCAVHGMSATDDFDRSGFGPILGSHGQSSISPLGVIVGELSRQLWESGFTLFHRSKWPDWGNG